MKIATELSNEYGDADQVPLVNPQDFREKLARLATAYAILDRNFTADFTSVNVEDRHVMAVANLVDGIYSDSACNLRSRSRQSRSRNTMEDFDKIRTAFEAVIHRAKTTIVGQDSQDHFIRFLLYIQTTQQFRKREVSEHLTVGPNWVSKRLIILQSYNLIETSRNGAYRTTRKFNLFMQRWLKDEAIQRAFQEAQDRASKIALENDDDLSQSMGYQAPSAGSFEYDPFISRDE